LDLIQTENGFAVVSNSNQAPASKERVERLLQFVTNRITSRLDRILLEIHSTGTYREEWKKAENIFSFRNEIVFLTTNELKEYTDNESLNYKDLDASHPSVLAYQSDLSNYISGAYIEELILKSSNHALTNFEQIVFHKIQTIIGLMIQKKHHYELIEKLVNYLIAHPDDCPTYLSSTEYRLKISKKYENKKHDPTFFFGG
jgi:hypothetical protein